MFNQIAHMDKDQLLRKLSKVKSAQNFINSKLIKIAVVVAIAFVWIDAGGSEEITSKYDPAMILNAVILLTVVSYAVYSILLNKTLNLIAKYFTRLIGNYNIQTVNDAFDNRHNDRYVFDYCFEDFDRGDIVSVQYGKNAGDYVIKHFFDKDNQVFNVMINSIGIDPSDPRYKSVLMSQRA